MTSVFGRGRLGLAAAWLGLLLILSAGCSSKGTVSGKVTVNDEPVRRGTVTFIASSTSWASAVAIGQDGSYTIVNAPPGPVKISVAGAEANPRTGGKFKGRKGQDEAGAEDMPPNVRNRFNPDAAPPAGPSVPKKYSDAEKSGLTYEIKPGKQEHNIELK